MQHITYQKGIVMLPVLHSAVGLSDPNPMTVTSAETLVAGAKRIAFQITGTEITTRSAVFTVTVSYDGGDTYQSYAMLLSNAANSNSQTLTRVASVTQAATGTTTCFMSPETLGAITHIVTSLVITDTGAPAGTFTVKASIQY